MVAYFGEFAFFLCEMFLVAVPCRGASAVWGISRSSSRGDFVFRLSRGARGAMVVPFLCSCIVTIAIHSRHCDSIYCSVAVFDGTHRDFV